MSIVALTCALIAIDGDTLRCGAERIRLLGIDAPEMPGHCQEGRDCAPGDPVASKNALAERAKGPATIERIGRDHYDRTLARVRVNGIDLSCAQIQSGHAIYRPDWDQFAFIATDCPSATAAARKTVGRIITRPANRLPSAPNQASGWSYRNCGEARRAGAAPLRRGQPGYGAHMDGDGDGIACEPIRR